MATLKYFNTYLGYGDLYVFFNMGDKFAPYQFSYPKQQYMNKNDGYLLSANGDPNKVNPYFFHFLNEKEGLPLPIQYKAMYEMDTLSQEDIDALEHNSKSYLLNINPSIVSKFKFDLSKYPQEVYQYIMDTDFKYLHNINIAALCSEQLMMVNMLKQKPELVKTLNKEYTNYHGDRFNPLMCIRPSLLPELLARMPELYPHFKEKLKNFEVIERLRSEELNKGLKINHKIADFFDMSKLEGSDMDWEISQDLDLLDKLPIENLSGRNVASIIIDTTESADKNNPNIKLKSEGYERLKKYPNILDKLRASDLYLVLENRPGLVHTLDKKLLHKLEVEPYWADKLINGKITWLINYFDFTHSFDKGTPGENSVYLKPHLDKIRQVRQDIERVTSKRKS